MSSIHSDYAKYTDIHGLIQPEGNTSDNGIRFTAQYVRAVHRTDVPVGALCAEVVKNIRACQPAGANVFGYRGLYNRYPGGEDKQQSHDDYRGLALIAFYCDPTISMDILSYGRQGFIRYNYNNVNPGTYTWSSWLGRFPQMIAMHKVAAGEKLSLWDKLWVFGAIHSSSNEQDAFVFTWMLAIMMKGQSWYIDKAIAAWQIRLKHHYAMGIGQVLEEYYGHTHPDGTWLKEDYGD